MSTRRRALAWAAGALVAGWRGPARAQAAGGDGLAGLDDWLDAQRRAWRVPGLAVALVRDGQPVYLKGFGLRDSARALPVTTDTLFRGGSTTKALAAATVAMLVDEGRMSWDAPVSTYIPEFRLAGGDEYRSLSLRDMLSHRSGLPRHDLLWYHNQTLSRQELVARMRFLEASAPLRARYQYNNLMVVLAGHAVERVSGQTWEAFAQARLLRPLGMVRANFSALEMAQAADHAVGHEADAARRVLPVPLRHDPLLGPAGALNASIADYALWLQLQLARGHWGGRRLISGASMAAMWEALQPATPTPQEPQFAPGYVGLGWRIDRYRDTVRVAHGGDLNGFTARVVLLPQKQIGLALLVNHGDHPLPNALTPDLLDRLLELPPQDNAGRALARRDAAERAAPRPDTAPAVAGTRPSREFAAYAGSYVHPGYGEMRVTHGADALAVRYNDMPAALRHRHYDVFEVRTDRLEHGEFNGLKLVFHGDEAGRIGGFSARLQEGVQPVHFTRTA